MKKGDNVFISYPSAVHYSTKGNQNDLKGKKAINHLLWGDYVKVKEIDGNWVFIRSRLRDGWVRKESLQENRILEVNFVDIGQGDGCHIQTPNDKAIVIDAGVADNMFRFLRWRFGRFSKKFTFESFMVSHPDKDHYYGFKDLLEHENVFVENFYHNGIVEQVRGGKNSLGTEKKIGKKTYLSGLVLNKDELKKITKSNTRKGDRLYPNLLKIGMDSGRVNDFIGLLAGAEWDDEKYVPGYAPSDNNGMTLKILGPVPKQISNDKLGLPKFSSTGKTKNGHSVVLLLEIGSIKMLLGGDLNEQSQDYLLEHYTGLDPNPNTQAQRDEIINEGKKHFGVDISKACHHGSSDVSPIFLSATDTLITVVSSGDDEPHAHPRPDTLGIIGKYSRSERPFIFSTELARSAKEAIKHPYQVRKDLREKMGKEYSILNDPNATHNQKEKADERLRKHLKIIDRSVANYGMINVRTDGNKVIVAYRLERDRSKSKRWDIHIFETDTRGRLNHVNKS